MLDGTSKLLSYYMSPYVDPE